MDTVYIETTVVGNIAGRFHPDPNIAFRQRVTRDWWVTAAERYNLVMSQMTVDECADGDPSAAAERLVVIEKIPLLDESPKIDPLANLLVERSAIPASQARDAIHVATAAVHCVQFITTWNFKHILNPHQQTRIADTCREAGFSPPVICTPEQLKASENDP